MDSPPETARSALEAIGNTPVVQLNRVVPKGFGKVFVKLEHFNPTGSYKDRMARTMVEGAERRGTLKKGMTIVEGTGGSTGSSLAFVCAVKGYDFHVISSNAFAREKLRTMAAFGAKVELIVSPSGSITPDLIPKMMERARALGEQDGYFFTDQLNNRDSLLGYEVIGQELLTQFPAGISAFCGAVGTAGMLIGVSRALKSANPSTRIVLLEPAASPVISRGYSGSHHIEGTGIGFRPPLLQGENIFDEARGVDEGDARSMCRRLASEEGIFVGTSSGANVASAIALAGELGPQSTVVTVACDTGLKYTNGNLFDVD